LGTWRGRREIRSGDKGGGGGEIRGGRGMGRKLVLG